MKIATFNIHHGCGIDRRVKLSRILRVLKQIGADILALQEVDRNFQRSRNEDQAGILAEALKMHLHFAPAIGNPATGYGIALLSRFPLEETVIHKLPSGSKNREQQVAQTARMQTGLGSVAVLNTHLGLRRAERRQQSRKIAEWVRDQRVSRPSCPLILCGDWNAGPRSNGSLQPLFECMEWRAEDALPGGTHATFPSYGPVRKLDYILVSPELRKILETPYRLGFSFVASDHLPFLAQIARGD